MLKDAMRQEVAADAEFTLPRRCLSDACYPELLIRLGPRGPRWGYAQGGRPFLKDPPVMIGACSTSVS
ncbi:hypothetical protein V7S43_011069 [Phytophthora oleae]|uniref:Uncharacterized protein n=1 Tax=Phytophthora oleae TaxID=2107226 RepID=A0ABD3FDT9_9STRA